MQPYRHATPAFASQTLDARKVLAVEIAGLGDLVHSLPSLWALRNAWPRAELHCLVRAEYASLLDLTPWIDRVWPYARGTASVAEVAQLVRGLRAESFDVAVDLMGSDHASAAAWLSGAKRRLIRQPGPKRPRYAWRWCATDVMVEPLQPDRMYLQRWKCLQQAGLAAVEPRFQLLPPLPLDRIPSLADLSPHPYLHISPYTRLSRKELPPDQMADLVQRLQVTYPQYKIVLSCGFRPRERRALDALVRALPAPPWKVFEGNLAIPDLFRLIQGASLHLGGDTGSMHLAWLAGVPSVFWMSPEANHGAWAPVGAQHQVICAHQAPRRYLDGIPTDTIVAQAAGLAQVRTSAIAATC